MNKKDIVILIPAYNPTEDLIPLVDSLLKNDFKVVVVNDGSKDETKYIFDKLDKDKIYFLEHEVNKGKGQALKTGFKYIKENIKCIGVVTADADGQHILSDISNVATVLCKNSNSLILGSRLDTKSMPFTSRNGNRITRFIFKLATGTKVFDTQTGLRGVPYTFLDEFLKIPGERYEYEINMLIYTAQHKIPIKEISIKSIYLNDNKASSFKLFKDSYKIYKCIFKYSSLSSLMWYVFSSLIALAIDFCLVLVLNSILQNTSFSKSIALLISVVIARVISSGVNFTINKKIAFKDSSNIFIALLKYYLLAICVLVVNYLLLDLLTVKLSFNLAISKLFVELLLFITNYLIQKLFIFKKKKTSGI